MEATSAQLRIALAQVNTTVGDIDGNAALVADWIGRAKAAGAGVVVFPEQTIGGYPAEDLWLKQHFLAAGRRALDELAAGVEGIVALVGFAEHDEAIHNSLAVVGDGAVQAIYRKMLLPNYGVFDERRYFEPGTTPALIEVAVAPLVGLTICEDVWFPGPPASLEAAAGAQSGPRTLPHRLTTAARVPSGRASLLSARRRPGPCSRCATSSAGRTSWSSTDTASSSRPRARCSLAAAQFDEELVLCDLALPASSRAPRTGCLSSPASTPVRRGSRRRVPPPR